MLIGKAEVEHREVLSVRQIALVAGGNSSCVEGCT